MSGEYTCIACGAPRERAITAELPGHTTYAPCASCGAVGIQRAADSYKRPQMKKPNVKPYHESPYRGGKVHGASA